MNYKTTIGFKVLDGWKSINGKVAYPFDEWIEVPSNGCYVAMTGGIYYAGRPKRMDANHVMLECEEPLGAVSFGVQRFRRVKVIKSQCDPLMIQLAFGFRNGNLVGANLTGQYLIGFDFSKMDMSSCILDHAVLDTVNLFGANLYGAKMRYTTIKNVSFYGANMRAVDFSTCYDYFGSTKQICAGGK